MKDKFQELKDELSGLFGNSTDPEVIKKSAVIASKIDVLKNENEALIKSKGELLEDYKKAIITASFAPGKDENLNGADAPQVKTFEEALKDFKKGIN